jgi:photoactive yellow protein
MSAPAIFVRDHDVFEFTPDALDALPYGVVTLDRQGRVLHCNRAQAAFARKSADRMIGLNFFTDVAPCTNVLPFKGRFDRFAVRRDSAIERFDFTFTLRWGQRDISITLLRKRAHEEIVMLVRARSAATIEPSAPLRVVEPWRAQPGANAPLYRPYEERRHNDTLLR